MDNSHIHMTDRDGNYIDAPEPDDRHGWTMLYQTYGCEDHAHRVLGWVGDLPSAIKLSLVAVSLWHPLLRAIPTPAPQSDMPAESIGIITDLPEELAARVHAGEIIPPQEILDAGATGVHLHDEVLPIVATMPQRVVELMEERGIDVVTLITDAGEHRARQALVRAGGREVWEKLMAEFPATEMSPGQGHEL